jgi:hypothetical protein
MLWLPSPRFVLGATLGAGFLLAACGSRTALLSAERVVPPPVVDAGPDSPVVTCKVGTFQLDRAAAQLMFVLDRSGSMRFLLNGTDPDPSGQQPARPDSRWRTLQRGLDPVLTALEGRLELGAKFFPEPIDAQGSGADACLVRQAADVPPRRATAASILNVFETTRPVGGTPTADAIRSAVAYLKNGARRVISRYMVLATDGAPNCNEALDELVCVCTQRDLGICRNDPVGGPTRCLDDTRTVKVIQEAAEKDRIPTFVIGLGTSDEPAFESTLNRMAIAGGRPRAGASRFYGAQSATELETALSEIQSSVAECTYVTPSAPTDPNAITIEVNGVAVTRDTSKRNGWDWVDQAYGQVALFGAACDLALRGGEGSNIKGTVTCDR